MPRLPAKQREAEKISTPLPGGGYAASANDVPPRHAWDGHATALISNLKGDRRKRRLVIEKFITVLSSKREEFRKEKKTGAGATTEAIEFYRRVLSINTTWKGKPGAPKGPRKARPDGTKGSNDGEANVEDSSLTGQSIDSEEFLDQHNDHCEVCNSGGEVICCATCNLVFHLKCVRPALKALPPDNWSCAYCDSTGVTGFKKESRQRKRAEQAVREMQKMQEAIRAEKKVELTLDDGKDQTIANSPVPQKTVDSIPDDDNNDKRKGDVDETTESLESNQSRSQRQRRQPTIYNPQNCAASDWQTDGKSEWRYLTTNELGEPKDGSKNVKTKILRTEEVKEPDKSIPDDEVMPFLSKDEIPPEILRKLSPKITVGKKHGQYHCRFCGDNESTQTCIFCACRVCFSKHDKDNTILCDICDAEYHIFCLSPPLKKIPENEWFCPTCRFVISEAQTAMKDKNATTPKGAKKGRPKGSKTKKSPKKVSPKPLSQPLRDPDGRFTQKGVTGQVKRGPGRPPKSQNVAKNADLKRARPRSPTQRNSTKSLSASLKGESINIVQKGMKRRIIERDQPAKVFEKSNSIYEEKGSSGGPMFSPSGILPFQNQRSRSGRILKRNTVYDQMTEGEQHLKTSTRKTVEHGKSSETNESQMKIQRGAKKQSGEEENETDDQILATVSRTDEVNANAIKIATEAAIAAVKGDFKRAPGTTIISASSQDTVTGPKVEETSAVTMVGHPNITFSKTAKINQAEMQSPLKSVATITSSLVFPLPRSGELPQNHHTSRGNNLQPSSSMVPKGTVHQSAMIPPASTCTSPTPAHAKVPRRKPGARECMQMSRKFGNKIISHHCMEVLLDYCSRGKVEHLIKMRERLDEHSRYLESELAGLEMLVEKRGDIVPEINDQTIATKEATLGEAHNVHTAHNAST